MRIFDNYTTTNGVQLTATTVNPVTITGSCDISINKPAGSAVAVDSVNGQPYSWYIRNFGVLTATGAGSAGVGLFGGGAVLNQGLISGDTQGIYAGYQPATVINFNIINGLGTGGRGILLAEGGRVDNGGFITGEVGGIEIEGGYATVANSSLITDVSDGYGVKLYGSLGNLLTNSTTGKIKDGVIAKDSRTMLINNGEISGSVGLAYGGLIQNGSSGSTAAIINGFYNNISGAGGTVVNHGSMSGYFIGVDLDAGGSFSNAQPGAVVESTGVQPNTKTGVLFYDADGTGGAHASQPIATLTNHSTLTAADLFFIK